MGRLKRRESQRGVTRASHLAFGSSPIAGRCVFVRHACRVEDLPSRSRKGDHRSAGRWFLEQIKDPGRA